MDLFMKCSIEEAEAGLREGGIPIGSVLVRNGQIISRGRNRRVQENNPILHAEIDCLINAGRIRNYRECTLYSTLMPCYLCAGAVVQFGIRKVVVSLRTSQEHGVPGVARRRVIDLDLSLQGDGRVHKGTPRPLV